MTTITTSVRSTTPASVVPTSSAGATPSAAPTLSAPVAAAPPSAPTNAQTPVAKALPTATTAQQRVQEARRTSHPSRPPQPVRPIFPSTLTFSPEAWLQLQFLCHAGETEIGAFGIAARDNPFHIVALGLPRQSCSCVTVEFDDVSVADFFDEQIDKGRTPDQFARVWIHTHPGHSAEPSGVDEDTFARVFGKCDWAVMFILAKGGATTCRLRMTAQGVGNRRMALDRYLDVRVAWEHLGDCAMLSALEPWWFEYAQAVQPLQERWGWGWPESDGVAQGGRSRPPASFSNEQEMLDWFDGLDPDEQQAFMEDMRGGDVDDDRYERSWSDEFDGGDDREESFSSAHFAHADRDERSGHAAGKEATHAE